MRQLALVLCAVLLSVSTAFAVPTKLAQQGRLLDGEGEALEGTHALRFALYDADVDGTEVWTEDHAAAFDAGYYSVELGSFAPLDDLIFAEGPLWLELAVDGEALSPRQEIVSVPYALRATAAEHLEGGSVDAQEIAVDGAVVIDAGGNWVGPTPEVSWNDLSDIPADLADGDQDTDILGGLSCASGQLAKWDGSAWACDEDIDTVDANTDTLAGLSCLDGEVARYDLSSGLWLCDTDLDTDTQLSEAQVLAYVLGVPLDLMAGSTLDGLVLSTGSHTTTLPWTAISGIPADLADGDQDTVVTTLPWSAISGIPVDIADGDQDTNTQLTDAQVDGYVVNGPLNLDGGSTLGGQTISVGAHTVNTDGLADLQCGPNEMIQLDPTSGAWACIDHMGDPDIHHSSTSDGLAITPASLTIQGSSTVLTDGEIDLGPNTDDALTGAMVETLTGGGDAEALHTHAGSGGGVCYTAWRTTSCGTGFTAAYTGFGAATSPVTYGTGGGSLYCFSGSASFASHNSYAMNFTVGSGRYWSVGTGGLNCAVCCK